MIKIKSLKALVSQNKVLWIVTGLILCTLIGYIWDWSLQSCSSGRSNIRTLYVIETNDFYG